MFKEISDNELLYLIRVDNVEARECLLERYKRRIYGIIDGFKHERSIAKLDYDECYSVCMLAFLKCLNSFEEGSNFFSYVQGAMNNALCRYWQSESKEMKKISLEEKESEYELYKSDMVVENKISYFDEDMKDDIKSQLSDIDREIFDYTLLGYNGAEIARILGISYKAYHRRITKIKGVIREKF